MKRLSSSPCNTASPTLLAFQPRDDESAGQALCAKNGTKYTAGENALPLWGTLRIYDTQEEALRTLGENYLDSPSFVRLVLVADAALLRSLCKPGDEVVPSETVGLYLSVSSTCPAFYAIWDDDDDSTHMTHEVLNELKRQDNREALLKMFNRKHPLSLKLSKSLPASRPGSTVKVRPGVSVACSRWGGRGGSAVAEAGPG